MTLKDGEFINKQDEFNLSSESQLCMQQTDSLVIISIMPLRS